MDQPNATNQTAAESSRNNELRTACHEFCTKVLEAAVDQPQFIDECTEEIYNYLLSAATEQQEEAPQLTVREAFERSWEENQHLYRAVADLE